MDTVALQDVILAMTQERNVASVLQRIVEGIQKFGEFQSGKQSGAYADIALVRIWLINAGDICGQCHFRKECPDQARCLHLSASAGLSKDKKETFSRLDGHFRRFPIGVRKIGKIAESGLPLLIPDIPGDSRWIVVPEWMKAEGITVFAGHPLIFRGETLGVLGAFSRTPFQEGDFARLQSFANHAAVAIANARAFEEVESLRARLADENAYLRSEVFAAFGMGNIVGKSAALQKVMEQVRLVARTDATVLFTGESGTGKELFARAVHEQSTREDRILIKVNCSAVPDTLFESEFFGYVKGAFTGALKDRAGRFELADGGTLFLDEIGEIPLNLQAKLLRVLQEQEIERVGETRSRKINVRIIAATNRDLKKEVEAGRFRQDLYYRLSVFPIEIPPLRERRDDIAPLVAHFVAHSAPQMGRSTPRIDQATLRKLIAYDWPGNVRELQNVVERSLILWERGPLAFEGIEPKARNTLSSGTRTNVGPEISTRASFKRLEKDTIIAALKQTNGKIFGAGGAAELLAMKPTTLASRLKALGIQRKAQ